MLDRRAQCDGLNLIALISHLQFVAGRHADRRVAHKNRRRNWVPRQVMQRKRLHQLIAEQCRDDEAVVTLFDAPDDALGVARHGQRADRQPRGCQTRSRRVRPPSPPGVSSGRRLARGYAPRVGVPHREENPQRSIAGHRADSSLSAGGRPTGRSTSIRGRIVNCCPRALGETPTAKNASPSASAASHDVLRDN